jgi:peroxiredoxin Q/BCP
MSCTHLKIGDIAPNFKGLNENGEQISLSDYKGKKLILFFYPKDDTPGCTKEACNLRDNFKFFEKKGMSILGVSPDTVKKHRKFTDKYEFQYPLLADTEKETINAYGVWGPKQFMGREIVGVHRTTFVIDEEGKVEHIIKKVKTKVHSDQIKEVMGF